MATAARIDKELLAQLSDGPSGSPAYLQHKKLCLARFENHLKKNENIDLSLALQDDHRLETCLKSYFFGIRVPEVVDDPDKPGKVKKTGLMVPPKAGYAKNVKSVLFGVLAKEYKVRSRYIRSKVVIYSV